MIRAAKTLWIALWSSLLALPLLLSALGVTLLKPVDENRRKAALPSWPSTATPSAFGGWAQSALRWHEDNFGGRDLLIRLKNQLDFSLFHKSDRIHIGPDGFLFYRNILDVQIPQIERTDLSIVRARADSLDALGRTLASRDITLVVMTVPLKFSVYPELLPASAPKLPPVRRFDVFRQELAKRQNLVLFDTFPRLTALKSQLLVFNRTDFHWSEPAAHAIGNELLATLGRLCDQPGFQSSWQVEFETRPFSGGQAMFMPLFVPPSEMAIFPIRQPPYPNEGNDPPFDWAVHAPADGARRLPPTVFIGDSFVWALHNTGFSTQFSDFYFAHILRESSKKLHQQIPHGIRFVVLELLENGFLNDYAPQ